MWKTGNPRTVMFEVIKIKEILCHWGEVFFAALLVPQRFASCCLNKVEITELLGCPALNLISKNCLKNKTKQPKHIMEFYSEALKHDRKLIVPLSH